MSTAGIVVTHVDDHPFIYRIDTMIKPIHFMSQVPIAPSHVLPQKSGIHQAFIQGHYI
jgi:hypothetical protein